MLKIHTKHLSKLLSSKHGDFVTKKDILEMINSKRFAIECNLYKIILQQLCEQTGLTLEQVRAKSRDTDLVYARAVYCYLMDRYTLWNREDIGAKVNLDHSSVFHMLKNIDRARTSKHEKDLKTIEILTNIEKNLKLCGYL